MRQQCFPRQREGQRAVRPTRLRWHFNFSKTQMYLFMWIHSRATGSHLVSPPHCRWPQCQVFPFPQLCMQEWVVQDRALKYCSKPWRGMQAGSWGACKCLSVFFLAGGAVCHAHGQRGLAYAAVFMALLIHFVLPHGICLICCVHACVYACFCADACRH